VKGREARKARGPLDRRTVNSKGKREGLAHPSGHCAYPQQNFNQEGPSLSPRLRFGQGEWAGGGQETQSQNKISSRASLRVSSRLTLSLQRVKRSWERAAPLHSPEHSQLEETHPLRVEKAIHSRGAASWRALRPSAGRAFLSFAVLRPRG
jgi:hypothetical protein